MEVLLGSDSEFHRITSVAPVSCHELGCNLCGYAKTVYEKGMELSSGDYLLIADSCDAMRRIGDLLSELSSARVFMLRLPWKRDADAVEFLSGEIGDLTTFLENSGVAVNLHTGIGRFNDLVDHVLTNEIRVEGADLSRLYLSALDGNKAKIDSNLVSRGPRKRIALSGGVTDIGAFDNAVEKAGGIMVSNDTCLGRRPFSSKTADNIEPLTAIAERLLKWRSPCARFSETISASDESADATVFVVPKFCDFFDFVRPRDNVKTYRVELDFPLNSDGQLTTRIGALMEKNDSRSVLHSEEGTTVIYAGVDSGSTTTNGVLIDGKGRIIFSKTVKTGIRASNTAEGLMQEMTEFSRKNGNQIGKCISTGYGRLLVSSASDKITEISCHARGVFELFPEARGIIDIGGQDSKVIRLNSGGNVEDFAMNDKCAAGTGRFLEVMASALEMDTEKMSSLARKSKKDISISSVCTVFAESEVVSLIGTGERIEDISAGLFKAIAKRVGAMYSRLGSPTPLVFTGGVARNAGVVEAMKMLFKTEILIPDVPDIMGAYGAALFARESSSESDIR
jgi:predicted CoA-substrate-specific enzyme activase